MQYNSRKLAANVLKKVYYDGAYSNLLLHSTFKQYEVKPIDKGFITRLVYGTLQQTYLLDYMINKFSKVKTKKIKPLILVTLRLSIYQIMFMEQVPDSAVCNEAVKIIKKSPFKNLSGFVNGVLRGYLRGKDQLQLPDPSKEPVTYLSVVYSFPTWMVELWLKEFGSFDEVEALLKSFNKEKGVYIRVNTNKTSVENMEGLLEEKGIAFEKGAYLDEAIYIPKGFNIDEVPGYKEGLFTVQDESSMFVAHGLGATKKSKVLDMCSAPGGKTTHIAELAEDSLELTACDIHEHKIELIKEHANRLDLKSITVKLQDATQPVEEYKEAFDYVLVDAPCSGLGIVNHKPEIKLSKSKDDLDALVEIQRKILDVAQSYVKKGGTLVYSTCTINKDENENMRRWFLDEFPFHSSSLANLLPESLECDTIEDGYVQLLPHKHHTDGFFIARFIRKD